MPPPPSKGSGGHDVGSGGGIGTRPVGRFATSRRPSLTAAAPDAAAPPPLPPPPPGAAPGAAPGRLPKSALSAFFAPLLSSPPPTPPTPPPVPDAAAGCARR
jgi:hypothetical protein